MDTNELVRPVSWGENLLALGAFLLFPVVFLVGKLLAPFLNSVWRD